MSKAKLTRQGVRDLGHGKRKPTPNIPPKTILECPHISTGTDRFGNERCRDCGAILDNPEDLIWEHYRL